MRSLSAELTAEMVSLSRTPAGTLTAERWLPRWTAKISGLSAGKLEQYAHGHAAATAVGANAGADIIFRARSGSTGAPQDGKLYIAIIKGADLASPATWDSLWSDSGTTGLMYPAWSSDSGAAYGGGIAVVVWNNSGVWTGRVFYTKASRALCCRDYNLLTGAAIGGETTIATLGSDSTQLASMQVAACRYDEVFALVTDQVETSQAAWQKKINGSVIKRYRYSGSWGLDSYAFPYHTIMEGHAVKDSEDYDSATGETTGQWGKRPCGGLAAIEIDSNTVIVAMGAIHWRRRGYWTHNAGIRSFIYHRDSGWWEPGTETDRSDFTNGQRLRLPMFARNSQIEGNQVLVWSRLVEPADFQQNEAAPAIARLREVVWARWSADGNSLTQFERLGTQDDLTSACILKANDKLYAIGWRAVYESEAAAALCTVATPLNLGDYATGFDCDWNNRLTMRVGATLHDLSPIYAGLLERGMLVRATLGTPGEQVQVAQGVIDQLSPDLAGGDSLSESATLTAAADKLLQTTVSETSGDELAHNHIYIEPPSQIKNVAASRGLWEVEPMTWPNTFFPAEYAVLNGKLAYRLKSFPYAALGGGNPGKCLTNRDDYMGTWFKDVAWLGLSPRVEGAIEASVRFGITNLQDTFTKSNQRVGDITWRTVGTVTRTNGVYTSVNWKLYNQANNQLNLQTTANQYACMAGLICHAPEVGRKYSFVWEHQSNLSLSSHIDDTTRANETFDRATYSVMGSNYLYLLVSDYNGSSWVHRDVAALSATGLTPGKPADLRMQVLGGTIYCFYRLHSTGTPNPWKFAFSWKSGRFGASRFGLVGRGHATVQWDTWYQVGCYTEVQKLSNEVDFWGIKLSDGVVDRTMEEHLRRKCWQGFTATSFNAVVNEASRMVNAGTYYNYNIPAINPTLDFKVNIPVNGNEAGVFVRGISAGSPIDTCVKIGLIAHSSAYSGGADLTYYLVKRRYTGGAEVTTAREYSPIPLKIEPAKPTPVRVTVRDNVYAVWVAGNFAGHFRDNTALGLYYGLYAVGGNAQFSQIYVPELYEVPIFAPLAANQTMAAAVSQVLNGRRIKGVFQANGSIKLSYFFIHPTGPAFKDTLTRSDLRLNDRHASVVRVEGAYTFAEYASAVMLAKGRRFQMVHNPDIYHYEFAYREAQAILTEIAEEQVEMTFEGLPDLRVEPEDQVTIQVDRQVVAGDFIVDDIRLRFEPGGKTAEMAVGVRSVVVL